MNKKYFVLFLNPSRPNFAQTMTDEEKNIMEQHVIYWKKYMDEGLMLVFGPVFDPKEVYGLGIIAVYSEEQLTVLLNNDPASRINKYEYYPMRAVMPGQ